MAAGNRRRAAWAIVSAVVLGGLAGLAGMLLYPGGTWFDTNTTGYDFWLNFLCDAMHSEALNGMPNQAGALFTQASLVLLMLGLLPVWLVLPALFPARPALGKIVRFGGSIATLAMLTIPLTPSDRFGSLHGVAVSVAGPLGIAAMIGILLGLCSVWRTQNVLTLTTILVVALCFADLVLYLRVTWLDVPLTATLPIVQKFAFLFALLWMLLAARGIARSLPSNPPNVA